MTSQQSKLAATLPAAHITSLKRIEAGYWWYVGRVRWASRLLAPWVRKQNSVRYADLGCGTGGFAVALQEQFNFDRVALIDGDTSMLREVPNKAPIEVHQRNLQDKFSLPFAPNLVSCMDVIEHLENDQSFLRQLQTQLPQGARLVLSVPAHGWLFSKWDHILGHYRRYSKRQLLSLVRSAGFSIDSASYMWSAFMPLGLLRRFSTQNSSEAEFPHVGDLTNNLLKIYSDSEWYCSRILPMPFGTSLILSATKT